VGKSSSINSWLAAGTLADCCVLKQLKMPCAPKAAEKLIIGYRLPISLYLPVALIKIYMKRKEKKRKSLLVKGRPFTMERNAKMSWFIRKGVCNCS
jgi:hypothetical protein